MALSAKGTAGHEAGDGATALAFGTVASGILLVVTGAEVQPGNGVLGEVSFGVDDAGGGAPGGNDIAAGHTFTVTQNTAATGVGGAITGLATHSTQQGFTLTGTTILPNTAYLFTWTG